MEKITSGAYYEIVKNNYTDYITGYTVKLYLINSTERHIFTATLSSGVFTFELSSTDTADITAGEYQYTIVAIDDSTSDIIEIEKGFIEVTPNIYLLTTSDIRTHARICLDNIEAVIESRASIDQQSYSINGRQLVKMTVTDLLKLRNYYFNLVKLEESQASNGKKFQSIKVRFV